MPLLAASLLALLSGGNSLVVANDGSTIPPNPPRDADRIKNELERGRPRLLVLPSVRPSGWMNGSRGNPTEADDALLRTLRRKVSEKYYVAAFPSGMLTKAYAQAMMYISPSDVPRNPYDMKKIQDVGQILSTPYVLFVQWSYFSNHYREGDHDSEFSGPSSYPAFAGAQMKASFTILDVRDGTLLVKDKTFLVESIAGKLSPLFEKYMQDPRTPEVSSSVRMGEYMADLIYGALQTLPFKP